MRNKASVLVGLLWCVAILAVLVIGVLRTARLDLLVVKNYGDQIQAHYLALAGIEKAKALIYQDARKRKRSATNHSGELYDAPSEFRDVPLGRGQFTVFHPKQQGEEEEVVYGISDEESRLNLNQASAEELGKLYGMTPDVIAAILDWRDGDNEVTPGGAEADYYASLQPPYLPRNGPFQTTRELLMVRGVSGDLFFGKSDTSDSSAPQKSDGSFDAGWSGLITVDSAAQNKNAAGEERLNVQTADEKGLAGIRGISPELAKAIVAYRGQKQLESLADLLDVTAVTAQNQQSPVVTQSGSTRTTSRQNPSASTQSTAQPAGPKLVSQTLLMDIADDLMAGSAGVDQPGAININTASSDVLACLPGMSLELAQAIVAYRRSAGFFPNIAYLLKVDGMTQEIFKQVAALVCARSETFRILSEGRVASTGARKRIQVIVQLGEDAIDTLSWREDL